MKRKYDQSKALSDERKQEALERAKRSQQQAERMTNEGKTSVPKGVPNERKY